MTIPLATYTGWALRSGVHANDGCEAAGQYIPFPKTAADRQATGDPRPSIEERYPSFDAYCGQIRKAVDRLVKQRLMLCEDADDAISRLVAAGVAAGAPAPAPGGAVDTEVPQCRKHGGHRGGDADDDGHHPRDGHDRRR